MNEQVLGSIRRECVAAVQDLLDVHAPELDTALEMLDGVVTINMGFKIDTSEARPRIQTKIAFFINRVKDEREVVIDDAQGNLL